MKRVLIVNADDCNLTPGVTRAILDAHDHGIVTSTTFLVNLPVESPTVRQILKRKRLGLGLHLNVTLPPPLLPPFFRQRTDPPKALWRNGGRNKVGGGLKRTSYRELIQEYQSQIDLFRKIFGRNLTHLDTHHQIHDYPFFYRALCEIARRNQLPVRRSSLSLRGKKRGQVHGPVPFSGRPVGRAAMTTKTTDFLFGNLDPSHHWRKESLEFLLGHLPEGVSEIMCHPGRNDAQLRQISSFTAGREAEWRLFRSPALKKRAQAWGIQLSHYGLCYT